MTWEHNLPSADTQQTSDCSESSSSRLSFSDRHKKTQQITRFSLFFLLPCITCATTDPGFLFFHEGKTAALSQSRPDRAVLCYNLGHFLLGLFPLLVIVSDFLEHLPLLFLHLFNRVFTEGKTAGEAGCVRILGEKHWTLPAYLSESLLLQSSMFCTHSLFSSQSLSNVSRLYLSCSSLQENSASTWSLYSVEKIYSVTTRMHLLETPWRAALLVCLQSLRPLCRGGGCGFEDAYRQCCNGLLTVWHHLHFCWHLLAERWASLQIFQFASVHLQSEGLALKSVAKNARLHWEGVKYGAGDLLWLSPLPPAPSAQGHAVSWLHTVAL